MNTITAKELKQKIDNGDDFQIIDVREDYEFEDYNIGGTNIPLDNVISQSNNISKNKPVVFCCKTGKRSKAITLALINKHQFTNLYSLTGGVEGFKEIFG